MKNLQVEDIKDEWLYNALTQGITTSLGNGIEAYGIHVMW